MVQVSDRTTVQVSDGPRDAAHGVTLGATIGMLHADLGDVRDSVQAVSSDLHEHVRSHFADARRYDKGRPKGNRRKGAP